MTDWTKIGAYLALLDSSEFRAIVVTPLLTTFRLHYHPARLKPDG